MMVQPDDLLLLFADQIIADGIFQRVGVRNEWWKFYVAWREQGGEICLVCSQSLRWGIKFAEHCGLQIEYFLCLHGTVAYNEFGQVLWNNALSNAVSRQILTVDEVVNNCAVYFQTPYGEYCLSKQENGADLDRYTAGILKGICQIRFLYSDIEVANSGEKILRTLQPPLILHRLEQEICVLPEKESVKVGIKALMKVLRKRNVKCIKSLM